MRHAACQVGTSGWSYQDWKGRLYPRGLAQRDWLSHFAREFDTVELNNSFYNLPKAELVDRWREMVPRRFRFAIKLSRLITHQKRLAGCGNALDSFFGRLERFDDRRGPLLVQLPPSLGRDDDLLDAFLGEVKDRASLRWKVAVEFRDASWDCDGVREILDRHRAALVLADMPGSETTEPNDASFVYVRRHGPGGTYRSRYPDRQIERDAARIESLLDGGKTAYVHYNNDTDGHAVDNARRLRELVGERAAVA